MRNNCRILPRDRDGSLGPVPVKVRKELEDLENLAQEEVLSRRTWSGRFVDTSQAFARCSDKPM